MRLTASITFCHNSAFRTPHFAFYPPPPRLFSVGKYAFPDICGKPQSGYFPFFRASNFGVCVLGHLYSRAKHVQTADFVERIRGQFSTKSVVGMRRKQGLCAVKAYHNGCVVKIARRSAKLHEIPDF